MTLKDSVTDRQSNNSTRRYHFASVVVHFFTLEM